MAKPSSEAATSKRSVVSLAVPASRGSNIAFLLLLTGFILVNILSAAFLTPTFDEPLHYHYGQFVLQGDTDRIDDSSMPVSALNALPAYFAGFLAAGRARDVLEGSFIARLVTILFSTGVAVLVFRWSRALYGGLAALFSAVLYILDPNVIAHSGQITTDIYATGMITLTLYLLWRFAGTRRLSDGLLYAAALGLSQLVKYTALALFPLSLLALALHDWPAIRDASRNGGAELHHYAGRLTIYILVAAAISVLLINVGFLFNRTLTPLSQYNFRSDSFRTAQARLGLLAQVPIPLPYPYVEGLDWMLHTNQTADRYGNVYLLGRISKPHGFPGYYFVASLLKVPIASQVFIFTALALFFIRPRRRRTLLQNEIFILLPALFFTIYLNFFFNAQTGIRYYLVIFPGLYVFAGSLGKDWKAVSVPARALGAAMLSFLAVSVLAYFPYFTPYFNEIVWDKTQTYQYLADSNLEWGQSRGDLARYLAEHPDAVYDPPGMQPGLLVVSGSDLVGILTRPEQYAWLRDNFKPVDTIAYAYFVYRITPEDMANLCATVEVCP